MDDREILSSQNPVKYIKASVKKPSISSNTKKLKEVKSRPQSMPLFSTQKLPIFAEPIKISKTSIQWKFSY